ncbi:Oxygen-dependent choline dehydrogenase [Lachnellula occidentalis]|uniref:Oxygen-dependent choline dehydrogenase n=1 Tax=Lachnellula occidentalis TaxID=215460 RepID=A0A8H8RQ92_9HELO|nr:Oxygen-dependent choline dehydrogenase [Lachnellula occidentalis]
MASKISSKLEGSEYDYIVCGGGTSGSVLAARLAEDPRNSVLVIEAGQHNSLLENTLMCGGWSQNFETEADWNITAEPNLGINNRRIKLSCGKFLGGSSGVNGTACVRGTKQDYDDWNMPGWSGEEVFGYMKKAENFHGKEWFKADEEAHGYDGPLNIEPHDPAPISKMVLESMVDRGFKLQPDMFTTGDSPHGCGHAPRTVYKGDRTMAADYLLNKRPNLAIKTETMVDKIILEGEGANLKAVAVKVIEKDGSMREIKATKEIIVSGGAYCTPTVLMRSGIGEKAQLASHGIDCKVDLPGVGKNLMDHLVCFIFYATKTPNITTDHLLFAPNALGEAYRQWKVEKRGPLSTFPFGVFSYARVDERLKAEPLWNSAPRKEGRDPMGLTSAQPNIELFGTECYGGPKSFTDFPDGVNSHVFGFIAELFAPKSRGSVTLKSADPKDNPIVDHKYLSEALDVVVLSEACKYANEVITQGKGTRDIVDGSWPAASNHHKNTERKDWVPFVRDHATTCYHPAGTAKMGTDSDPMAVLDSELRVRGVKGLRVADTSVMPLLNQGHPQMPAYAIGEKAADLIRGKSLGMSSLTEKISNVTLS